MEKNSIKVFLDTNVLIAGIASLTGASAEILDLAEAGLIVAMVSEQVLIEADRNIRKKLPDLILPFRSYLKHLSPFLVERPAQKEAHTMEQYINKKDAPILAAALKGEADYLVTLDAKDFLTEKVIHHVPFRVMKPSDFLKEYRTLLFHG